MLNSKMTKLDNTKHHHVKPQAITKLTNKNCDYEIEERPEQQREKKGANSEDHDNKVNCQGVRDK